MQVRPLEHSSLYCLFAEDQRIEMDGKSTIIGWLPDNAVITIAPKEESTTVIPRLAVIAILMVPLETPANDVTFNLFINQTVIHSATMPRSLVEETVIAGKREPAPLNAGIFRMAMTAQNIVIPEAGYLRVNATFGDVSLTSNGLKFVVRPEAATSTN